MLGNMKFIISVLHLKEENCSITGHTRVNCCGKLNKYYGTRMVLSEIQ